VPVYLLTRKRIETMPKDCYKRRERGPIEGSKTIRSCFRVSSDLLGGMGCISLIQSPPYSWIFFHLNIEFSERDPPVTILIEILWRKKDGIQKLTFRVLLITQ
jgi:hypothetical protein